MIAGTFFGFHDPTCTPVVVYLHSHGGCQTEGLENAEYLRKTFNYVYFDFSGSG